MWGEMRRFDCPAGTMDGLRGVCQAKQLLGVFESIRTNKGGWELLSLSEGGIIIMEIIFQD